MKARLAIAGGLAVLACAAIGVPPQPAPEAQLAVEILPGFTQPAEAPELLAERVEILVDVPETPGTYTLELGIMIEHVRWFTEPDGTPLYRPAPLK